MSYQIIRVDALTATTGSCSRTQLAKDGVTEPSMLFSKTQRSRDVPTQWFKRVFDFRFQ